jgi:hypothetical protein
MVQGDQHDVKKGLAIVLVQSKCYLDLKKRSSLLSLIEFLVEVPNARMYTIHVDSMRGQGNVW